MNRLYEVIDSISGRLYTFFEVISLLFLVFAPEMFGLFVYNEFNSVYYSIVVVTFFVVLVLVFNSYPYSFQKNIFKPKISRRQKPDKKYNQTILVTVCILSFFVLFPPKGFNYNKIVILILSISILHIMSLYICDWIINCEIIRMKEDHILLFNNKRIEYSDIKKINFHNGKTVIFTENDSTSINGNIKESKLWEKIRKEMVSSSLVE
jgi:uncharacterized membrane protein